MKKPLILVAILFLPLFSLAAPQPKHCGPVTIALPTCKVDYAAESGDAIASGQTAIIYNDVGSMTPSFNLNYAGSPSTNSTVIQGCSRGGVASTDTPNCDTLDTYTGTSSSIRSPTVLKLYDYFTVTPTFTGGTSPTLSLHVTAAGKNGGGIGRSTFATLLDVNFGTPGDGDFFTWSQSLSKLVDSVPGNMTNQQSGSSYTLLTTDRNKWINLSASGAKTVKFEQAGASFPDGYGNTICNTSTSGYATLTPDTGVTSTIMGAISVAIPPGACIFKLHSDGINYQGTVVGSPSSNITTSTPISVVNSPTGAFYFNQHATAATAITFNLPTASAGTEFCFKNSYNGSAANTGTLTLQTSASGQFIFQDGTPTASGGYVISGGAAGDAACLVGIDSTHWSLYVGKGTWTNH